MHTADDRPYMPSPDEYAQAHHLYQQAPPAAQREIRARAGVRSAPMVDGKPIKGRHLIYWDRIPIALLGWTILAFEFCVRMRYNGVFKQMSGKR